ncbi:MAG: cytochrome P450 [Ilumatobacteraceae bacterium]
MTEPTTSPLPSDPDDPAIVDDPYDFYRMLRERHPVHDTGSEFLVSCFDDIQTVVLDWQRYSSQTTDDNHDHFASMDPPRHDVHRASVARIFTPRSIAALEPEIRRATDDLLAPLVERGTFDLAAEFASVLPSQVITNIVGVPEELREEYRQKAIAIATTHGAASLYQAMTALQDVTWEALEGDHHVPEGGVLDMLLQSGAGDRDDGDSDGDDAPLSRAEIVGLCTNLVLAGTDTASNLITNSVMLLDRHPDVREALRDDAELIPVAIEESLRFEAPVQWLRRRTTEPVELHGVELPRGALVRLYWASANRDESVFERADQFDITREQRRHLAFGHGLHFCIGAALARLEARVALEALLALPTIRIDPTNTARIPSSMFRGYEHLAVRTA